MVYILIEVAKMLWGGQIQAKAAVRVLDIRGCPFITNMGSWRPPLIPYYVIYGRPLTTSLCKHIYSYCWPTHKNVFLMAGSRHCGGRKDHIGRVLGLLQRHLCLHRPGRLLRPHGQKRLETLDQWILLLNLHCALKLISSEKSPLSYSCLMMSLWSQFPYQEFC